MIVRLVVGMFQANCYLVGCKQTKEAVVIDPGGDVQRILTEAAKRELTIRHILNTHGHWDHTGDNAELGKVTKAPVLIHKADTDQIDMKPDGFLEEEEDIRFGTYVLHVLHTPGHSPGGVCFSAPGVVFTGDTLFAGSIGRTDLAGGDYDLLLEGVRNKLFCMEDSTRVYPGHGPPTTIGTEKKHNPFLEGQSL